MRIVPQTNLPVGGPDSLIASQGTLLLGGGDTNAAQLTVTVSVGSVVLTPHWWNQTSSTWVPALEGYQLTVNFAVQPTIGSTFVRTSEAQWWALLKTGGGTISYCDLEAVVSEDLFYTKAQVDAKDAATLVSAEAFTYARASIDAKDAAVLAAAEAYTDAHVTSGPTNLYLHIDAKSESNTNGTTIYSIRDLSGACGPLTGGSGITWSAAGGPGGHGCWALNGSANFTMNSPCIPGGAPGLLVSAMVNFTSIASSPCIFGCGNSAIVDQQTMGFTVTANGGGKAVVVLQNWNTPAFVTNEFFNLSEWHILTWALTGGGAITNSNPLIWIDSTPCTFTVAGSLVPTLGYSNAMVGANPAGAQQLNGKLAELVVSADPTQAVAVIAYMQARWA